MLRVDVSARMTRGSKVGWERGDALLPIEDVKERAVGRVGDMPGPVPTKLVLPRLSGIMMLELLETDARDPMSVPLTIVREGKPRPLRRGRDVEGEVGLKGIDITASSVRSREREDEDALGIGIGMFGDPV